MNGLTNEIICIIYSYLDCCSQKKCGIVNKYLNHCYREPKYDYTKNLIYNCSYWNYIKNHYHITKKEIHNYYSKAKVIKNPNIKLNYVKTVTLEQTEYPNYKKYDFPKHNDKLGQYVYKNLRFENSDYNELVDTCEIEVDGARLDKIYKKTFNVLRYIYKINDNTVLPFHFCTDDNWLIEGRSGNRIYIKSEAPTIKLLIDIYEFTDFIVSRTDKRMSPLGFEDMNSQLNCCFNGTETTTLTICKCRLDFSSIVTHLILEIPDTKKISIQINGYDFIVIDPEMFDEYEYAWIKEGHTKFKININDHLGAYLINKIEKYDNHCIIPFSKSFLDGLNCQHNIIDNLQINCYGMNIPKSYFDNSVECNFYALCYHYATIGEI